MKKPTFVSFINGIQKSVLVRVNGYKVASGSDFADVSGIVTIWSDKVNVKVYDESSEMPILNKLFQVKLGSLVHFVLAGTNEAPKIHMSVTQNGPKFDKEDAYIRCVNLSGPSSKINLELSVGVLLFDSVLCGEETEYRRIEPSIYHILAKTSSGVVVGEKKSVVLLPNKHCTAFLIGEKPKLVTSVF